MSVVTATIADAKVATENPAALNVASSHPVLTRRSLMRMAALVGTSVVGSAVLAGCGSDDGVAATAAADPRPLTTEEAQRLAVVRFNNYDTGTRTITGTLTDGQVQVALSGWVDWIDHIGYGLAVPAPVGTGVDPGGPLLLRWTLGDVAQLDATGMASAPFPVPTTGWDNQALTAGDSFLAAGMLVLMNLGSDRPENPQLLAQSTSRWLRADTVGGVAVDVMTGPSDATGKSGEGIRYWVDATGVLRRLEVQLGGGLWSLVDFTDAPGIDLTADAG